MNCFSEGKKQYLFDIYMMTIDKRHTHFVRLSTILSTISRIRIKSSSSTPIYLYIF